MGHEDLGHHYYLSGDLPSAFKSYSRMRDFCTAPKHILDMSLQIIKLCIEQTNYMSVTPYIMKIRGITRTPEEDEALKPKIDVTIGLSYLYSSNYLDATRAFLRVPSTISWPEVISPNDVAIYGGLCALASMDRQTLKSEVLENTEFRNALELEPNVKRAIAAFYGAKYNTCLGILEGYKNDYLLDWHLQRHVDDIYERIRRKSVVQYFVPFSTVTLGAMAEAFGSSEEEMEKELVGMIGRGTLGARIDTQNRVSGIREFCFWGRRGLIRGGVVGCGEGGGSEDECAWGDVGDGKAL